MNRREALIAGAAAAWAGTSSFAQDRKPLRIVVGLAAGGTLDLVGRIMADQLQASLGRTVLVENRLGAGQRIALNEVKRAAPDGNTIYLGTTSPLTVFPHVYEKLDYDPVKDFTPIGRLVLFDNGIATGPATGAGDIKQLVAWLKANPTRANYGTPGNGTLPHFMGVALGQGIGVPLTHVAYKGSTPAMADLVGGQVPMLITSLSDLMELHRGGKLKVVAVTGERRSALLPDVPTLRESGIPVTGSNTVAVYGPANLPAQIVRELNAALVKAVATPVVREKLAGYGLVPATGTPEELAAMQAEELKLYGPLVKASGYVGG
jgi:tripartite-type tricarboxylate transporter receptor subunit TctC